MQFLPLYHVIISNMHVYSFTCMISHMHGHAPKTILHAWKIIIHEGLFNEQALIKTSQLTCLENLLRCHLMDCKNIESMKCAKNIVIRYRLRRKVQNGKQWSSCIARPKWLNFNFSSCVKELREQRGWCICARILDRFQRSFVSGLRQEMSTDKMSS